MTHATSTALIAWANDLCAATDQENWPVAAQLLAHIQGALRQNAHEYSKPTLEVVLAAVEHATQDTQRRRDEIGVLLKAFGELGEPEHPEVA